MREEIDNLCEVIADLKIEVWVTPEPVSFGNRTTGIYKSLKKGEKWAELFECGWFKFSGQIPKGIDFEGLTLRIDVNGELLMVDKKGEPIRALTNVSSTFDRTLGTPEKVFISLTEFGFNCKTRDFEIWADGACNDLFGEIKEGGTIKYAELVRQSLEMLKNYFDEKIQTQLACAALSDEVYNLTALGHAHLDLAWLWPIRESKRKGVRTFATAIKNMEKYPWYVFGASQAQLFKWTEQNEPKLFEKVLNAEKAKKFEIQGGSWVEFDTHIPDGESLFRQFIYGQKYFKAKFNHEVEILWLPDVFGYSASLPQIAKLNNINYILTMKNAWNQFNKFPYNAFNWDGIDGSSILAYRLPEETYNGSANINSLVLCRKNDSEKAITKQGLMLYGIGDGGAGPSEKHLEELQRISYLRGLPQLTHRLSIDFFREIAQKKTMLPHVTGELYLENHQGTFTTCEVIKKINRNYEKMRQELEFMQVAFGVKISACDYQEFEEEFLLLQFHDILPGTSIERVYDEALDSWTFWERKFASYFQNINRNIYFNPTNSPVKRYLKINNLWHKLEIAPLTWGTPKVNESHFVVECGKNYIANDKVKITFDSKNGGITNYFCGGNQLEILHNPAEFLLYEDKGNAWNIEFDTYKKPPQRMVLVHHQSYIDGPFGIYEEDYSFGESSMAIKYILEFHSSNCKVEVTMNWLTPEYLMRFEFPSVLQNDYAQYATQFGFKSYPTSNECKFEKARYEIAAQRFAHLRDKVYPVGVALVSDIKYGFSIKASKLNLTLLRVPMRPGAFMNKSDIARDSLGNFNDLGAHNFVFSIVVSNEITEVMDIAEWTNRKIPNVPCEVRDCGKLLTIDNPQIGVSAIRPSFDSENHFIRIYERTGKSCYVSDFVDYYEANSCGAKLNKIFDQKLKPFEIKTLILK